MADRLKLRLTEGRTVPLEDGSPWPTETKGKTTAPAEIEVKESRYWRRRVRDGDVVDLKAMAAVEGRKSSAKTGDEA